MIRAYTRTPQVEIEIRRPNYNMPAYIDQQIVVFGISTGTGIGYSTACVSYTYGESISSPDGDFSITLTLEIDESGKTWYDRIYKRDLVFFKEYGKVRYVGYVTNRRYQSRMSEKGPQRAITISGKNVGALLLSFSIVTDLHILSANRTAETESKQFMASIASEVEENQNLSNLIVQIKDAFIKMSEAIGGSQNKGIKAIIDKYIDFSSGLDSNLKSQYPMALSLFRMGENNLWDIMNSLLAPPFHEFFGRWVYSTEQSCKYEMVLRQAPFDSIDWMNLPITKIPDDLPPVFLQDYDIGDSDEEVKTMYGCFLPGSGISKEKALTLDEFSHTMKKDSNKWPTYGYRPLFVELDFYNRDPENNFQSAASLMGDLSNKLYDWFQNNADFVTGTVSLMCIENSDYTKFPRIGEKLGFLGGEFYIEGVRRSWQYMEAHVTTLSISRGYIYSSSGTQQNPITEIGQKIGVLEKANG